MARRKPKGPGSPDQAAVDESEWEDWRRLREEMGKRLGGRDATGVSNAEVLNAARRAAGKRRR